MQALSGIAFLLLVSCAWTVGVRMLLLARRTRALPEASLGLMLLCLMGIGYPLAIGAQAEAFLGLAGARFCQGLSNAFIDIGFAMLFVFTSRVFRAESRWAGALCVVACGTLVVHWGAAQSAIAELDSMAGAVEATRRVALLSLGTGIVGTVWTAFEAIHYHGLIRRRVAIGLADPVVCNRFLLWGAMGATMTFGALANVYFLETRIDVVSDPRALAVTSVVGIAQAALLYLGFSPPARYLRWVTQASPTETRSS